MSESGSWRWGICRMQERRYDIRTWIAGSPDLNEMNEWIMIGSRDFWG